MHGALTIDYLSCTINISNECCWQGILVEKDVRPMTRRVWSILIVDANTINRKLLTHMFQNLNVEITEAKDGYEAIELVQDYVYDMILIDTNMPGLNGYETTTKIRNLYPRNEHITIIATTTQDPNRIMNKAQRYRMNDVLQKPAQKEDVAALLETHLSFSSEDDYYSMKKAEIINIEEFEKFYQDEQLRKDILETIVQEKEKDLKDIKDAFLSKDCEQIYHKIHYFKGSFSYLKADKILTISQSILDFCKDQMLEEALTLEQSFTENYLQLQDEIKFYLQSM